MNYRWEANRCPLVVISDIDPRKYDDKQTQFAELPPPCAPPPQGMAPTLEWEKNFLDEFITLRQVWRLCWGVWCVYDVYVRERVRACLCACFVLVLVLALYGLLCTCLLVLLSCVHMLGACIFYMDMRLCVHMCLCVYGCACCAACLCCMFVLLHGMSTGHNTNLLCLDANTLG